MPTRRSPARAARLDLAALLDSWEIHLRAERKSPQTVRSYAAGVRRFLAWCEETGTAPVLDRRTVSTFIAATIDAGAEPATARARHLSLRRFSAWLAEEGETDRDELLGLRPPKLTSKVVDVLTDAQVAALINACKGQAMMDRRDEAIVRLMVETGLRSNELLDMTVTDVDVGAGVAVVRRGKGGKGRRVPFGPQTGRAIDRYLRARRSHRLADSSALWLGDRGKRFEYYGLRRALKKRAEAAGITGFRPHQLRHTAATRWLAAGGSEGGLMAVAGWSRRDMIDRYTKATSEARAAEEARRLNLGDL